MRPLHAKAVMLLATTLTATTLLGTSKIAWSKGRIYDHGPVLVSGHIRSNGTYVAPHLRSAPDNSKANNLAGTHPASIARQRNGQNETQTYDDLKKQLADNRARENGHSPRQ